MTGGSAPAVRVSLRVVLGVLAGAVCWVVAGLVLTGAATAEQAAVPLDGSSGEGERPASPVDVVEPNMQVTQREPGDLIQNYHSPDLAMNPNDPDHLVAASRFEQPDQGCQVNISRDAGQTWERVDLPELPDPASCWAPSTTVDDRGYVYVITAGMEGSGPSEGVFVWISPDGGDTFSDPVAINLGTGFSPGIAADTHEESPHTGRVYATWYEIAPSDGHETAPDEGEHRYRAYVTYSDDGGQTWSEKAFAYTPDTWQYWPDVTVGGPDGDVYVVYHDLSTCTGAFQAILTPTASPTACQVGVLRSTDGGESFDDAFGAAYSVHGHEPEDMSVLEGPGVAVTSEGDVAVVFSSASTRAGEGCAEPTVDVFVARSRDRGESWSDPVRVNDEPCELGADQSAPQIAAAPGADRLDVVFYDDRHDPEGPLADAYHAASTDGGASFSANRRLTDRSFDAEVMFTERGEAVSLPSQNFDRNNAVASADDHLVAAWGDARNTGVNSPSGRPEGSASDVVAARAHVGAWDGERSVQHVGGGDGGGADGVAVSVAVSEATFGFAEQVVIAPAGRFAEGLVAGPLARAGGGPVLLTEAGRLSAAVADEVERLAPEVAYVVGDEGQLSPAVVDELEALGVGVRRLAGGDRYATAGQVAGEVGAAEGVAVVVSGEQFGEAVAAGGDAAWMSRPVLLVRESEVPAATWEALDELGVRRTVVVGGEDAVGESVVAALADEGYAPERVAGADRYATSRLVAERAAERPLRGVPTNVAYVAAGTRWVDAVAAAPAAAYRGGPVVLGDEADEAGVGAAAFAEQAGVDVAVRIGCGWLDAAGFAAAGEGCGLAAADLAGLSAQATSPDTIELSWPALADEAGGVVGGYVVAQSRAPIASEEDLAGAQRLCGGVCAFGPAKVGEPLELQVTDLVAATGYHYAVAPAGEEGQPAGELATTSAITPGVGRIGGVDRFATAVLASRARFPADGSAEAAVLANAATFADALAGAPLAHARGGPLLLATGGDVPTVTADEFDRVLADGATVYLLGGTAALDESVADQVAALGYEPVRLAGATRTETAAEIAGELDDLQALLVARGDDFADAVAAGAAAAETGGAVLLTAGEQPHAATDAVIDAHPDAAVFAIGGPAARAYPDATGVVGAERVATSVAVAETFFDAPDAVGLARADAFPDALTSATHAAAHHAPLLLTPTNRLHDDVADWTCQADIARGYLYGGTAALAEDVATSLHTHLDRTC